jgi:hypothetical protein
MTPVITRNQLFSYQCYYTENNQADAHGQPDNIWQGQNQDTENDSDYPHPDTADFQSGSSFKTMLLFVQSPF